MMKTVIRFGWISLICAAAATIAGCGGESAEEADAVEPPGGTAESAAASPAWLAKEAPADAVDVAAAKATAVEGDRVVVRGRIGGRRDAIGVEAPVFVMMDPAIPSCADNPEDGCGTPWDYCCETPEAITANSATVQVVGASDGAALRTAGLTELDEVIVEGVVGPRPTESVLVIRADRLSRIGG